MKLGAALYAGWVALVITGIVGGLGLAFQQPWLFPSLGPTIFIHTVTPQLITLGGLPADLATVGTLVIWIGLATLSCDYARNALQCLLGKVESVEALLRDYVMDVGYQ